LIFSKLNKDYLRWKKPRMISKKLTQYFEWRLDQVFAYFENHVSSRWFRLLIYLD
jgi:hypothetical protein